MPEPSRVFISHSSEDAPFADRLSQDLRREGITVWLARDELRPGDSFVERLDAAIGAARAAICVLSESYLKSKWMRLELDALTRRFQGSDNLIPVVVGDIRSENPFTHYQFVDFRGSYEEGIAALGRRLTSVSTDVQSDPSTPTTPAGPPPDLPPPFFIGRSQELQQGLDLLAESEPPVLAVVGPPGIGKTAFARELAHQARERGVVDAVVALTMRDELDTNRDIVAILAKSLNVAPDRIASDLARSRTLCILDGVDEIPSANLRFVGAFLTQIQRVSPRTSVILTARDASALQDTLQDVPHRVLALREFRTDEVFAFVEATLAARHRQVEEKDVREFISNNPLGGNPLLLRLLAANWQGGVISPAEMPGSLEDFFEAALAARSDRDIEVLEALASFDGPVSARSVSAIVGERDCAQTERRLAELRSAGMVTVVDDRYHVVHAALADFIRKRSSARKQQGGQGSLFLMIDPSLMCKEDIVDLLETLNAIYARLGGDELVIREDEVGRFAAAGVPV